MKEPVGPQLQRALKALSDLYQTDHHLAAMLQRSVAESLHMMTHAAHQPSVLTTIYWPPESTVAAPNTGEET